MTDNDLNAVVAYLRTLKPITNKVPDPIYKMPQVQQVFPGGEKPYTEAMLSDKLKKGFYLATIAHCMECHTPMGPRGREFRQQARHRRLRVPRAVGRVGVEQHHPEQDQGHRRVDRRRDQARHHARGQQGRQQAQAADGLPLLCHADRRRPRRRGGLSAHGAGEGVVARQQTRHPEVRGAPQSAGLGAEIAGSFEPLPASGETVIGLHLARRGPISRRLAGSRKSMRLKPYLTAALLAALARRGRIARRKAAAQERRVPTAAELRLSYAPVVQRVAPAVVNVYAAKTVQNRNPLFEDPIFRRFFGVPGGGGGSQVQRSLGSGVIVDASGLIVTNNHVIEGRRRGQGLARRQARVRGDARAQGPAQRSRRAAHQGRQRALPVPRIRQFRRARGRRRGARHRQSVRRRADGDARHRLGAGAHAGRHHRLSVLHPDRRRHQSGQFRRRAGRSDRPAGRHQHRDLLALGRLARHRLRHPRQHGAGGGGLGQGRRQRGEAALARRQAAGGDAGDRRQHGPQAPGRRADRQRVVAGGPAAQAGLKPGDVIVSVDGQAVDDPNAFDYRFATKPLGGTAQLGVLRAGRELTVAVALQTAPETPRDEITIRSRSPFSGAKVANLSPALADELQLDNADDGVVVLDVDNGSYASNLGFRRGDVIVSVNGEHIAKTRDLARATGTPNRSWRIVIRRGGQQISAVFNG